MLVVFEGWCGVWKGWCEAKGASNPSGSRPNFFGRQHLTFDKGGKGVGVGQGLVRRFIGCRYSALQQKTSGTVPYPINLNR